MAVKGVMTLPLGPQRRLGCPIQAPPLGLSGIATLNAQSPLVIPREPALSEVDRDLQFPPHATNAKGTITATTEPA